MSATGPYRPVVQRASRDIVAIDFGTVGGGKPVTHLLSRVDSALRRLRVVNPLDIRWRSDSDSLAANAEAAANRLLAGGLGPRAAVIGQCTGAAFALAVAESLARSRTVPAAVALIEPVFVTPQFVAAQVYELVTQLGGDPATASRISAGIHPRPGGLSAVSSYLDAQLRVVARARVASLGLDEVEGRTVVDELVGRYVDWTGFLLAQLGVAVGNQSCPVHVLGGNVAEPQKYLRSVEDELRRVLAQIEVVTGTPEPGSRR